MEKHLIRWMEDMLRKNTPLSLLIIQEKAVSLYNKVKEEMGIEEGCFTASHGWFERFKKRAHLNHISVSGEAASADVDAAKEFPQILAEIIEEGGYLPEQIFNVDETGLFWKRMPTKTYIFQEEKSMPGFKVAKDRVTLMIGGNASGDFKLKPLAVHRAERPRAFKGLTISLLPVIWYANRKAWVTMRIFEDWFVNHFIPAVKEYCKEKKIPFKILLILDNAPGHPPGLDDLHPNVKVIYLPPRTTSILQPMDQGVIKAFKTLYQRYAYGQAFSAIDKEDGPTLREFWKSYNMLDCIKHVNTAWKEVSQKCMNGVWGKLCPQFVNDFTGFGEVEEARQKCVDLANAMQLDIEDDDIDELLESDNEELTNDELLEIERYIQEEEGRMEEEPEVPKRFTAKGLRECFSVFESGFELLEAMDSNVERVEEFRKKMNSAMACYHLIYEEKARSVTQATLDNFFKPKPSTSRDVLPSTSRVEAAPSSSPSSPTSNPDSPAAMM